MKKSLLLVFAAFLVACQPAEEAAQPEPAAEPAPEPAAEPAPDRLTAALDAQPDDVKARYQYRHPKETLEFFGIEPGMTVVEGLPGQGWYTKVLLPFLGSRGDAHRRELRPRTVPEFFVHDRGAPGRDADLGDRLARGRRGMARRRWRRDRLRSTWDPCPQSSKARPMPSFLRAYCTTWRGSKTKA